MHPAGITDPVRLPVRHAHQFLAQCLSEEWARVNICETPTGVHACDAAAAPAPCYWGWKVQGRAHCCRE